MNLEICEQRWKEVKGVIQFLWGHITEDELDRTQGRIEDISALIELKYDEDASAIKTRLEPILYKLSDISEEMEKYFAEEEHRDDLGPPLNSGSENQRRDISAI